MEPLFEMGEDALMVVEEENDDSQRHKHLPDNVLKNIFKHLSYQDILRCHLACTHMHKYLSENVAEFARPQLDDLIIESVRDAGWLRQLRLEFKCMEINGTHACLKKTEFSENEEETFEPVSKLTPTFIKLLEDRCRWIVASGDVTFRYIYIDDDVLQHLMKFFESARGLFFTHCTIDVSEGRLRTLLALSKCVKFGLNESQFVQTVLNDHILDAMSHCDILELCWCKPRHLKQLTNRTLIRWGNQKRLPKKINLDGMCTEFTTSALVSFIKAFANEYREWLSAPIKAAKTLPVQWNLGEVVLTDNPYHLLQSIEGIEVRHCALILENREEYDLLPSWASHIADNTFVAIQFTTRHTNKHRHKPLCDNA
uniref:F-box domain-containing protein n=1 Tax=Parascaris univalens TaxID=6257 RepID=A0A915CCI2_PARUN